MYYEKKYASLDDVNIIYAGNDDISYTRFDCEGYSKIKFNVGNTGETSLIVFRDKENKLISSDKKYVEYSVYNVYDIPENCKYAYINVNNKFYNFYKFYLAKQKNNSKIIRNENEIIDGRKQLDGTVSKSFGDAIRKQLFYYNNCTHDDKMEEVECTWDKSKYIDEINGKINVFAGINQYAYTSLSCSYGEKIYMNIIKQNKECCLMLFTDENGFVIEKILDESSIDVQHCYNVPKNASKCYINTSYIDIIPSIKIGKYINITKFDYINNYINKKPIISFVDDDGHNDAYTKIKPILDETGIKMTFACVSDYIANNSAYMDLEKLWELQDLGHEIVCHSKDHSNDIFGDENTANERIIYKNLYDAQSYMKENSLFGYDILVYPYGGYNGDVALKMKKCARKLFKYAFSTNNGYIDGSPIDSMLINRQMVTFSDQTLIDIKYWIDVTKEKKCWLIFSSHAFMDSFNPNGLKEIIEYIKNSEIDIMTLGQALKYRGNIESNGEFDSNECYYIGYDGTVKGNINYKNVF